MKARDKHFVCRDVLNAGFRKLLYLYDLCTKEWVKVNAAIEIAWAQIVNCAEQFAFLHFLFVNG